MECRRVVEEVCGKEIVQTAVGAGKRGEAMGDVVAVAGRAVEQEAPNLEEEFVGEGEKWHQGGFEPGGLSGGRVLV